MFEIVKAIHEALHTESTWAFVLTVAIAGGLLFGGVAWIVDKGYRNALANGASTGSQRHSRNHQPRRSMISLPPWPTCSSLALAIR